MANENQSQQNLQETAASLSAAQQNITATSAATNREFKESVNLLTKMNKLIDDSTSKTASFEKSTINIKRIQQERERILRKEINLATQLSAINDVDKRKADEYITNIEKRKKLEEDILKKRSVGNYQQATILRTQLSTLETTIEGQEQLLNVQQLSAIALKQSEKGLKERVGLATEELENEKRIEKQLGKTGTALKVLNKYLLFGKDTYSKMVEEAREGENTTKKWVARSAILVGTLAAGYAGLKKAGDLAARGLDTVGKGISGITGSGGPISKLVSPFTELIGKIPIVGGLIGGVVDMLANVADYATEAGSQVQLFARNLGMSVADATKLNAQYSNIAHSSGDLLFNSKKFRETQMEIAEATGRNNLLSAQALQTQIQLKEIAGIDLETRKQLVDVETVSGVRQDRIVKAAMGTSNFVKQTLGVSIKWQNILKEAASLSGVLGLSFAKYPEKLTRSLVSVKAMGLELKQLDSLADSFLDFESSISKEFEAQLLTGKDINLNKAREAFLNNDLVEAGKELVNQLGTSGEFLSYNRIQQDALAASAGMTRDQVADMLKQQEVFSRLQVNDLKAYQQKVALMSKTVEGQKELVGLLGQEEYSKVMSQTATEKIANFIEKIKQSFADLLSSGSFKGFLDKVIEFISDPKNIENLLSKITGFISVMIKAVASVLSGLDQLPFVEIDKGIISSIRGYADELGSAKLGSLMPTAAGTSVGGNAANAQATAASQPAQNNMGMVGSTGNNTPSTVNVKAYIVDTARTAEIRYGMYGEGDKQT
jgi:hypothetical protein